MPMLHPLLKLLLSFFLKKGCYINLLCVFIEHLLCVFHLLPMFLPLPQINLTPLFKPYSPLRGKDLGKVFTGQATMTKLGHLLHEQSKERLLQQRRREVKHKEIPRGKVKTWIEDSGVETSYIYEESVCFSSTKDCVCSPLLVYASITPGKCSANPINFSF